MIESCLFPILFCRIIPKIIKIIPMILENNILSFITIRMTTKERKGVRYIKLLTCAVVDEYFRAFIQITKVMPISNRPI